MNMEKPRSKKASQNGLEEGLQASLAEEQAGRVLGPFTTAEEAMEFLEFARSFIAMPAEVRNKGQ
ncbi:MAG: hypothetical protein ACE5LD_04440 [Candidatus Bipolaricaulia bacterium]